MDIQTRHLLHARRPARKYAGALRRRPTLHLLTQRPSPAGAGRPRHRHLGSRQYESQSLTSRDRQDGYGNEERCCYPERLRRGAWAQSIVTWLENADTDRFRMRSNRELSMPRYYLGILWTESRLARSCQVVLEIDHSTRGLPLTRFLHEFVNPSISPIIHLSIRSPLHSFIPPITHLSTHPPTTPYDKDHLTLCLV